MRYSQEFVGVRSRPLPRSPRGQRWRVWLSPYLVAAALAPAFVQIDYSGCANYGNSRLSELELIVDEENRLVGFDSDLRSYTASLPFTSEVRVRSVTEDPEASVSIFLLPEGESLTVYGERETYLDVGVGGSDYAVPLPPGSSTLQVWVAPYGGATDYYEVSVDVEIPVGEFPCTEQGLRDAIAAGGGPHIFPCQDPIVTTSTIDIDSDVILDGLGMLTVDGNDDHLVFRASPGRPVTAELRGVTVIGGRGGGIYNEIALTLVDATVSGNHDGWGILNLGRMTLTDSVVSGNGSHSENGGGIANGRDLTIANSVVSGNSTQGGGGGILHTNGTLTLIDSVVSDNSAFDGGGILAFGPLTLINSIISDNAAMSGFEPGIGGGVWVGTGALEATLVNSEVSGNVAGYGGGIAISSFNKLAVTNSLISGNAASTWGGGIHNSGTVTLTNSTVSSNTAQEGSACHNSGTVKIVNGTLLGTLHALGRPEYFPTFEVAATSIVGECTEEGVDVTWTSNGHNIESPDDTCGFHQATDQVKVTAQQLNLAPLADNGGPTMTHALLPGSVAIDAIPEADCVDADGQPLTTDQRGEPRPEAGGTMCDIGAFELQP